MIEYINIPSSIELPKGLKKLLERKNEDNKKIYNEEIMVSLISQKFEYKGTNLLCVVSNKRDDYFMEFVCFNEKKAYWNKYIIRVESKQKARQLMETLKDVKNMDEIRQLETNNIKR